ncbi:MAG: cupin domain-containing protein [Actinobacteria bacterium]|nr:cupin domain-containing protein [Actinomycetota bacterium]
MTADVVGPQEGTTLDFGGFGVRFIVRGTETNGAFALVEHPLAPRALAAPLHRHTREDEFSYVVEGRMGALLGDRVVEAGPGDFVFKRRDEWHTFWNAGDEPARLLELISPAGFEAYFEELAEILVPGAPPDFEALARLQSRYGLEMDPDSVPGLVERFGLRPPGAPAE